MNTSPTATTTVKRQTKDGHVENVTCPLSIQLYNSYMGGVDRADQLRGYYRVRMKSHKFYRFVFLNLLVFTLSVSSFPLSSTDTSSGFSWTVALWMLLFWWNTFSQALDTPSDSKCSSHSGLNWLRDWLGTITPGSAMLSHQQFMMQHTTSLAHLRQREGETSVEQLMALQWP